MHTLVLYAPQDLVAFLSLLARLWLSGCRYLLEVGQVATVPGDAFGAPDCIRLSYAASMADLEKALDRLATALSKIQT